MRNLIKGLGIALAFFTLGTGFGSNAYADDTGHSLSRMQQIAGSILSDINQAAWISEGKGPHIAYVFFDPNCPYCHKLYESTRSWVKTGKLELRWIPVGILMTTSHGKAISMLAANDPLQAFYKNEDHYTMGNGGVDEDLATPAVEKKLSANEALLERTHLGAVPLMLFYTKNDIPMMVQGSPPKDRLAAFIAQIK